MSATSPVILLTGASRGLGLAVLNILLTKFNAKVSAVSRSRTRELDDAVRTFGEDRVLITQGDLNDPQVSIQVVQKTLDKFGRLDSVVLNAGTLDPLGRLADIGLEDLAKHFTTNVFSLLYTLQPALPHLRDASKNQGSGDGVNGRVVFVSSGASVGNIQGWGAYSAGKAALNSLARTLGNEEKDNGVACWAVRPGMVDTAMQQQLRDRGPDSMVPNELARFVDAHKDGTLLPAEKPAHVLAALAVKGSMELTGQFISWDSQDMVPYQAS